VGELVDEARLADAGLAHDRHQLPCPAARALEGVTELVHLGRAANESCETAGRGGLQSCPRAAAAREFIGLDRL
jgi:hypothetical protein